MRMPKQYWTGEPLLKLGWPWLTPGAIEILSSRIHPTDTVCEFGAGGSTVFFANRCRFVLSWEPDPAWRNRVSKILKDRNNVTLTAHIGDLWATTHRFDIVLVDSDGKTTDRQAIAEKAIALVKPFGCFIFDNYGRYRTTFLKGWKIDCYDDPHWSGRGTLIAYSKVKA